MANFSAAAANANVVPKAVENGGNWVMGVINHTTALSAGDVFAMCKVPRGGRLIGLAVQGAVTGTSAGIGIGDAGSATRHGTISITSTSTTLYPAGFQLGTTYLSANDTANEWLILATVGSAVSNSGGMSLNVLVGYVMDGLNPTMQGF